MHMWQDVIDDVYKDKKNREMISQRSTQKSTPRDELRYYLGKKFPGTYLTPREMDCAKYLVSGFTHTMIADLLGLSTRTIEYYTKNIRMKLHCHTRTELVSTLITFEPFRVD